MKWRKVAESLEATSNKLLDENHPETKKGLLVMAEASEEAQVSVAAARVAAAIVLASLAAALRAGLVANHQGSK
jgi:hypothetical protein